ncbi:hypothetical protein LCGC14_3054940 [marine sediment metagenome]|uniref:Cell envelope biogenesis protein TolA n=1 Tax=marine sediment metagenome TaxID=412755 RepID=A0A0F8ZBI3_9ZZZZ
MKTGTYISGIGHAGLIGFALFGPLFAAKPLPPPEVADVQLLSEEEFAALTRPELSPEVSAEAPAPAEIDTLSEDASPVAPEPEPVPEPQPEPPVTHGT